MSPKVAPVSAIPDMVKCPRILFNRDLVLHLWREDVFVEGDCDENITELCSILGWKDELFKQNKMTRIKKDKTSKEDEAGKNTQEK